MALIECFCIKGLFGKKDIDLNFKSKAQIYIGENGLGKTTILNALNYLLSCDFKTLVKIIFSRIDIIIKGRKFSFSKEEITNYLKSQDDVNTRNSGFYQRLVSLLSDDDVNTLQSYIRSGKTDMEKMQDINTYLKSVGYNFTAPSGYLMKVLTQVIIDRAEIRQIDDFREFMKEMRVRILYFPTYRRIEKDVRTMLRERRNRGRLGNPANGRDLESPFVEEFSEAVHSGMSDIKKRRDSVLEKIASISRKELDALSVDLLKKQIAGITDNIILEDGDIDKIEAIINKSQVGLSAKEQERILLLLKNKEIYNDENKFLLYLLTRLKDIYNSYEAYDKGIKEFVDVCNGYLRDKHFAYNEAELNLDLEPISQLGSMPMQEVIDLDVLSSGEKQLVALFATIYLEPQPQSHFIFLIDEPELSLSIYWQRKLLPDVVKSPNCDFLFAVTHSPFIFENELRECTTGLNEFVKL